MFVGKQALGEMPALFFTLAGYLVLAKGYPSSPMRYVVAGALWGLAAAAKMQVMPFLILAALILIGIVIVRRDTGLALGWGLALVSLIASLMRTRWLEGRPQGMPGVPLS